MANVLEPTNPVSSMNNATVNALTIDRASQDKTVNQASVITGTHSSPTPPTATSAKIAAAAKQNDEREIAYNRSVLQGAWS